MDYNGQNLNGTSLDDIAQNNYQQQMINNSSKYNMPENINNYNTSNNYNSSNNYKDETNISENFSNKLYNNEKHIKEITKEILNGLTENNISLHDNDSFTLHKKKSKNKKMVERFEEELDSKTNDAKNIFGDLLKSPKFKDILILFVLFFLMSQEMVKDLFAKYFTSINPDETGKVGATGVVIYGIILAVLFVVVKNFF